MAKETRYAQGSISFEEAVRLYRAILRETGGEYGFVSESTLRYVLDGLMWKKGDVFQKAAFVIREIATKHPLVNGNKRLAFALGALFLRKKGYELTVELESTTNFMLRVAKGEVSRRQLKSWLQSKSKKIS